MWTLIAPWAYAPRVDQNFADVHTGSVFDYLVPQWLWVSMPAGPRGVHNVKFGLDIHRLHMNHYGITAPSFSFTDGATALNGGTAPTLFNSYADFLLGLPITRNTALQNPLLNDIVE